MLTTIRVMYHSYWLYTPCKHNLPLDTSFRLRLSTPRSRDRWRRQYICCLVILCGSLNPRRRRRWCRGWLGFRLDGGGSNLGSFFYEDVPNALAHEAYNPRSILLDFVKEKGNAVDHVVF